MRVTSVAPSLRQLVRRAGPLRLAVRLGADALVRPALLQLLKLAVLEGLVLDLEDLAAESATGPGRATSHVRISRGDREHVLEASALGGEAVAVVLDLLASVVPPLELAQVGLAATTDLSRHVALRAVAERVLEATDDHAAASALLGGLTSGEGLGFHRAALFVPDADGGYVGLRAVGPSDAADAHRIWEALEEARVELDEQLGPTSRSSPLEARVQRVRLAPRGDDGPPRDDRDEVAAALMGRQVHFVRPRGPHAAELAALEVAPEFVLCRFAARGHVHGLLFADRRFGPATIEEDRLQALGSYVSHAALAWETRRLLRDNEHLARRDGLTGLLNRRAFEEVLAEAVRGEGGFGVLLIDLDHFRDVNNTRGHEAGDAMLRAAGDLLREEVGGAGIGARFGGDELAAVLLSASQDDLARIAERVGRTSMRRGISMSLGAAAFPGDCATPSEAVGVADRRLYEAKAAGRGCGVVPGRARPIAFGEPSPG